MARYPIAYLRRSSADTNDPGDVSREAQEAAVRELAARDGHNGNVRVLDDWDRSADEAKESRRKGYLAMLAAIERDEVSAVYVASLDRLYRSMRTFVRLTDAARAHDVRIVSLREGVLGGDNSPMAQAFAQITAVFSELELNTTKARMAAVNKVLSDRHQHMGMVGYGYRLRRDPAAKRGLARDENGATIVEPDPERPLAPIIEAVRMAGSILGGCKVLQAWGIPSPDACAPDCEDRHHRRAGPVGATRCSDACATQHPHTGAVWGSTTLRRIIAHNAPELLPAKSPTGRRTPAHSILAQLLVCHCGQVLTPEPSRRAYRCRMGVRRGAVAHGPAWVSEADVLPAVRAEVSRARLPGDRARLAADHAAERSRLAGQLERAHELYIAGKITRERHAAEEQTVAEALEALGSAEDVADLGYVDDLWTWAPADANAVLRAILRHVRLGPDMRPLPFTPDDWRNPALRG